MLIGINLVLAGLIKASVCLYAASLGITKVFNIPDQKTIVVPCALLMNTLAGAGILYSNSISVQSFIKAYPFYALPFEVILPLIIWVGAEIQNKIKTAGTSSKPG